VKRPRKVTDWIGVVVALIGCAVVVWLVWSSGPVAAIWPAAR
jgi:hypothetical protein